MGLPLATREMALQRATDSRSISRRLVIVALDLKDRLPSLLHRREDIGLTCLLVEEGFIPARERTIEGEARSSHKFHDFTRQVELTDGVTPEGQTQISIRGLQPLDMIDIGVTLGDLCICCRVEVATEQLGLAISRSRLRDEAVLSRLTDLRI